MSKGIEKKIKKKIKDRLGRRCKIHNIEPISVFEAIFHMVYSVMKIYEFKASPEEQQMFIEYAKSMDGSLIMTEVATKLFLHFLKQNPDIAFQRFSETVLHNSAVIIEELINNLSSEEGCLLNTLCMFSSNPIPCSLVSELSSLIASKSQQPQNLIGSDILAKLLEFCIVKKYPPPVVYDPTKRDELCTPEFVCIPPIISQHVQSKIKCCSKTFKYICEAFQSSWCYSATEKTFMSCLCGSLLNMYGSSMGEEYYEQLHRFYQQYKPLCSKLKYIMLCADQCNQTMCLNMVTYAHTIIQILLWMTWLISVILSGKSVQSGTFWASCSTLMVPLWKPLQERTMMILTNALPTCSKNGYKQSL